MTHVNSEKTTHTLSIQDKDMEERVRLCTDAILMDDQIRQFQNRLEFVINFCNKPIIIYCIDENGSERGIEIGSTHLNEIRFLEQAIFERVKSIQAFYKI